MTIKMSFSQLWTKGGLCIGEMTLEDPVLCDIDSFYCLCFFREPMTVMALGAAWCSVALNLESQNQIFDPVRRKLGDHCIHPEEIERVWVVPV